jgi:hypothetical protein
MTVTDEKNDIFEDALPFKNPSKPIGRQTNSSMTIDFHIHLP